MISYNPHDKTGSLHTCDDCHKFTTKEWFKKYQEHYKGYEPEIYLCEQCGGNY
jgi:hypothetical protein